MGFEYREDQKKILEYQNGHLGVPSVPGAGKTFMLIALVENLSKRLKNGEKILILTYMNSAVSTIKERLIKKEINNDSFEVMTIHSFAMKLIKENHQKANISDDFLILSDQDKEFHLTKILNGEINKVEIDKIVKNKEKINQSKKDLLRIANSFISFIKMNGVFIKDTEYKSELSKLMINTYIKYQEIIARKSYLDYDDILYITANILKKNKAVSDYYKNSYTYIIEDESQDSNIIQNQILDILAKEKNLIRFGDMNQSIMGFANSEPKLFRNFCEKNEKKEILTAGRSSEEIIKIINFFVKWVKEEHPNYEIRDALQEQLIKKVNDNEKPKNPKLENYGLGAFEFEDQKKELESIALYIERFRNKFPDKTVAVLFSNRYSMSNFADILNKISLKFSYLDEIGEKELKALKKTGQILDFIAEPYNRNKFYEVLSLITEEEFDIRKKTRKLNVEDILEYDKKQLEEKTELTEEEINKLLLIVKKVNKILSFPKHSLESLLIYISESLNLGVKDMELITSVISDIKQLYKINPKMGVKELSGQLLNIRNNRYSFVAKKIFISNDEIKENLVLSTYHKSKGNEWDAVFLTGLTVDNFPHDFNCKFKGEYIYFNDEYINPFESLKSEILGEKEYLKKSREEKIEEMIRLIYVGLSRAKEYLYLSTNEEKEISLYFKELKKKIDMEKSKWKN